MLAAVPRSLLMTFFGAFLRRVGGWIAVADLVALMGDLALDEQAVRSAMSRLKRREVVAPERRGGAAGYRLTAHGTAILEAGDARIYGRAGTGAAEWLLVVFSIPESRRALRHRLRTRLQWLGLGTVAAGVWIAPAPVEPEVRRVVAELGLSEHVELFRGAHLGDARAVASWWDLDALAAEYRAYVAAWEPVLADGERSGPGDAFAAHVRQLDAWRRIPFHDPGLPASALPADWPGGHAWEVFRALDRRLSGPALRHVEARVSRP
jgi:phenylacetic acid degradation operon negative regulatory protein